MESTRNQRSFVGPIGCDYTKILPAIEAVSAGRTVKMVSGTYNENVVVDKSLTINGAGAGKTIIDGNHHGSTITIGQNIGMTHVIEI